MKITKQKTRILSPEVRKVRDALQKVCEIDKYELKDSLDKVIGWSVVKEDLSLYDFQDRLTVNGFISIASSEARDGEGNVYKKFTYKLGSLLISVSVFDKAYSIELY